MSTRWNFEEHERLKKYLDKAHEAAKEYLLVHAELDSSKVYNISDIAAKKYSKDLSVRDIIPIEDYIISEIREKLHEGDFPTMDNEVKPRRRCRGNPIPEETVNRIIELLQQGRTGLSIAKELGVAQSTVSRIKNENKENITQNFPTSNREDFAKALGSHNNSSIDNISNYIKTIMQFSDIYTDKVKFSCLINGKRYNILISESRCDNEL